MFDDGHCALSIVIANEDSDRVECVEEKVWIELRLECGKPGARELFGEPGNLNFAFTRVDKVTSSVLDSHNAEIDRYAERQSGKDPAEPFNSKPEPELCRALLHRSVIDVGCKSSYQDQTQQLTATGPCNTEQEGKEEVQHGAANKIRARKWPSPGNGEHAGREKRVK